MESYHLLPDKLAVRAEGTLGVAYTYNEPLINIEYVLDCAESVHRRSLKNVLVTNGYVEPIPGRDVLSLMDAVNLDVKSMDSSFYRALCGGELEPVLAFGRMAAEMGVHLEITQLLIPGYNDNADQIRQLCRWIADHCGVGTALHLSAYHPAYRSTVAATQDEVLLSCYEVAKSVLPYVYLGNTRLRHGRNTCCEKCGAEMVLRNGYTVQVLPELGEGGVCGNCGHRTGIGF